MGKDFLLKAIVAICGLVWLGALVLDGTVAASKGLIAPFSVVVSVAGGLTWLFDKWLWNWPLVRLLVGRPDLRGTWKGEIASDWIAPQTGAPTPPIPTFVVVTQTATSLHIRQLTKESNSLSLAAAIMTEADDSKAVVGVYRNEPTSAVRDRSPIHLGALRLREAGKDEMAGEYWTDRETRGQVTLRRVSRRKAKSFEDAAKLPP